MSKRGKTSKSSKACDDNMALDMETMKCVDVNLTLNPKWEEFYEI